MKIGYARVSTTEQNLDLQIDSLEKAGCEKIFTDKVSSTKKNRAGLTEALEYLRPNDTLIVWKLDRLCRSIPDLIEISLQLEEKEVELQSITDSIDTSSPSGRAYFVIIGAFAQMERELLQERIKAGIQSAKKRGRVLGRPKVSEEKVRTAKKLLDGDMSYPEVAESLSISLSSLYKYVPAKSS